MIQVFEFQLCASILKATGKKARNLRELRDLIEEIGDDSIYHHTYQYFLKGHALEYTNDFAQWAGESLEERVLAEHLSNIDPYDFSNIGDLRQELLRVVDDYLSNFPEPRDAMRGDDFHFNQTITFVFPAGFSSRNLAEFLMAIKHLEVGSIYYHFYEARMRLGKGVDDFSAWISDVIGKKDLADRIRCIDPLMHSIEGVRQHIIEEVDAVVRQDIEEVLS
ncbi:MAG: DUF5752 family protein [Nitrospiraceae bacterium]|nr:DUF5752 family protein [Nitrospiraceae bacterium]